MSADRILVFDIGGTTSRAGIYDAGSGRLQRSLRAQTPSAHAFPDAEVHGLRSLLYELMRALAEGLSFSSPHVISVGFPGPVDARGVALRAPTVWGADQEPEPVAARIREIWPLARVLVANDLSTAGYCFLRHDAEDFCVVTVSSGIGHKVFLGGRPVVGAAGRGGEIGHLRVDFSDEAPVCECGGTGHLGALASGRAIHRLAVRLAHLDPRAFLVSSPGRATGGDPKRLDNILLAQAFREGDHWATELVRSAAEPLGRALAGIHSAVGIERFVIMGGVAHAFGLRYLDLIGQAAARSEWALGQDWSRMIELGEMGDDAGLIGAGRLAARFADSEPATRRDRGADPLLVG